MTTFAVLCQGRTGSSLLVDLLDSHPQVTCHPEIFSPDLEAYALWWRHDPSQYLDQVLRPSTPAVGFKLPLDSLLFHPEVFDVLEDSSLKIVRLYRPDRLAQYVSLCLAQRSGVWSSQDETPEPSPLHLDPVACVGFLRMSELHDRLLDAVASSHETFMVSYDAVVAGDLDELQRFLGVEPGRLESTLKKLAPDRPSAIIANKGEIWRAVQEAGLERYFSAY